MALNIISSNEQIKVDSINILIYGQPGAGKSSIAFTSNKSLMIDFDKGSHRSAFRKDVVQPKNWAEVASISKNDLKDYDTIIIDTLGRLLDFITQDIIQDNPKMGQRNGALTLQGYGALKSTFTSWLKQLNLLGKDVVFIAHDKEDKDGDNKFIRPDVTGGSYNEIMKVVDFVGYYFMENNKRVIDFNPCERFIGKNSANISKTFVPDFKSTPDFLASLIQIMKDSLNNATESQKKAVETINELKEKINSTDSATSLNEVVSEIKSLDLKNGIKESVKQIVTHKVKELGLQLDKEAGVYFKPEPVEETQEESFA